MSIPKNMEKTKVPVEGLTFKDQDILFDGHSWKKCTFEACNIILEFGYYDAVGCNFPNCKLTLRGVAQAITQIVQMFYPDMPIYFFGEDRKKVLERMRDRLVKEGMLEEVKT